MVFLARIGTRYYYNRRVPDLFKDFDPRTLVRVSLKTDSKTEARRKAIIFNEQLEAYWQSLIQAQEQHSNTRYRKVVRTARQMGFTYQPMAVVAALPLHELLERVLALHGASPLQTEAILGIRDVPDITVRDALAKYWEITTDKVMNKTAAQLRKWRNPRIKAIENFVGVVGNKKVREITRADIVAFRDWWIVRVQKQNKNAGSANKDVMHLKCVLEAVSEHEKLELDITHLFRKIRLETRFRQTRKPFSPEQIRTILHSPKLEGLNEEAKWFLFAASETGARPSELCGLLPEDIRLDAPVPHIAITDRISRPLKNVNSQREIPLVGYALDAFRAMPEGFMYYRDRVDSLTTCINKFLRENKLTPSRQHTVYSLRHSFQDRILAENVPDRIQAELMGHAFARPKYGDGGTLEHKLEYLNKICLKQE